MGWSRNVPVWAFHKKREWSHAALSADSLKEGPRLEKKTCSLQRQESTECKSQAGQPRESGDGNDHDQGRKQIATVLVSSQSEPGARSEAFEIVRVLSMEPRETGSESLQAQLPGLCVLC